VVFLCFQEQIKPYLLFAEDFIMPLPPVRRIVTGHDEKGKAIIESDTTLSPFDPRAGNAELTQVERRMKTGAGFIHIWRTEDFPAKVQGQWTEYHNKQIPLSDDIGTTVRIVDMAPQLSSPMHRTISLDFGVVLSGEVVLELDDGVETTVKAGDTVVQRGTIHAWHNRTDELARILFVLVPSEKVVVNKAGTLEQTRFAVN
jgi:quercetin dioxygenase-like cupin family protein